MNIQYNGELGQQPATSFQPEVNNTGVEIVAFSFRRPVELDALDFLKVTDVKTVLEHPNNELELRKIKLGVSIVNMREMKQVIRRTGKTVVELLDSCEEEVTSKFPERLEGEIGEADMLGVKSKELPGPRFVGFELDQGSSMYVQLWKERTAVFEHFDAEHMLDCDYMPFISLFRTRNFTHANGAYNSLLKAHIPNRRTALGKVKPVTIDNRDKIKRSKG